MMLITTARGDEMLRWLTQFTNPIVVPVALGDGQPVSGTPVAIPERKDLPDEYYCTNSAADVDAAQNIHCR